MINANEGERREISRMDRLRSASKERKKVLKFGILFEIHILPAKKYRKICDDSMIGMNIREFLELDGKKKKLAKFSEFFIFLLEFREKLWGKIRRMRKGKKIGKRIKQRPAKRSRDSRFFPLGLPRRWKRRKKKRLEFHSGGSPASNSIPDLLCPAAQWPEDSCALSVCAPFSNERN